MWVCGNMNKTTRTLMFSSKRQDWATPKWLFDILNDIYNFTLDPCATKHTAKCKKYYTKEQDGLSKSWKGERVFVNPPFGREIKKWIKKGYEESIDSNTLVVFLIPARTDTSYFHDYIYNKAKIVFLRGRIKFGGSDNPAPFPSMLVILKGGN